MEYISSEKFLFEVGYDGHHGKDGSKTTLSLLLLFSTGSI